MNVRLSLESVRGELASIQLDHMNANALLVINRMKQLKNVKVSEIT